MSDPVIAVFGNAAAHVGEFDYEDARALGRGIAERGWVLCNGGYGGTMEAAAHGAVEGGGHTIGVTCPALPGRGEANAYIRQEVPTFDLFTRVNTLVRLGDAYIALPGGTGTLLEVAAVWELTNKGLLGPAKPLILVGAAWEALVEIIAKQASPSSRPQIAPDISGAIAALDAHFSRYVPDYG